MKIKSTKKHYVTYLSPGSFVSEQSTREVKSWNLKLATKMSNDIVERHGAVPYAFFFETRHTVDDLVDQNGVTFKVDSVEDKRSDIYYLHGRILTFHEMEKIAKKSTNFSDESVVRNMQGNRYTHVIESTKGYRTVHEFNENHVLVDESGVIVRTGKDSDIAAERKKILAEYEEYWANLERQWAREREERERNPPPAPRV